MDFLKDVATPQSLEHYHLLLFVLNVLLIVYVPYLAFLLGSAAVSYSMERLYRKTGSPYHRKAAAEVIATAFEEPKAVVFMAVVPSLALLFVFAQLMQGTPAISVGLLAISGLCIVAAAGFLQSYRSTFRMRDLLEAVDPSKTQEDFDASAAVLANSHRQRTTGRFGLILLTLAAYFLAAAIAVAANPDDWAAVDGLVALTLSADVLAKFLQVLAIAAGVTGLGILFYLDRSGAGEEYRLFLRRLGTQLTITSIIALPLLVIAGIVLLPKTVLSGMLFGLGGASFVAFLLTGIFVYGVHKEPERRFGAVAFFAFVIATSCLMTGEQVAIHNATKQQAVVLALEYEAVSEQFRASLGISTVSFTGEDIYNGRCSACHLRDERKVGPPFKLVAEKYRGKQQALVAFIRNPQKVDPTYPPMPNQGLRPAEVDSIASYLLRNFGQAPLPAGEGQ